AESGRAKPGPFFPQPSCTPIYTSKYRYIVWGELVRAEKVDENRTPPEELR
ncbi:class E sortase, partial [Streptomyces eurythermus]